MTTTTTEEGREKRPKVIDLRDRLGVRKVEIPFLLPISLREVEDLIASDPTFPQGFAIRPNGLKKYDKGELQAWWEAKKASWRAVHPDDRRMPA